MADARDRRAAALQWGSAFGAHLAARSPLVFRHSLVGHPDLEREAVACLAESLGDESVTCEQAVKPLVFTHGAPEPQRARQAAEIIRNLEENESWMTLLNIEQRPHYARLIDDLLNGAAQQYGVDAAALRRRMGFIFASSPHSVTGAHFDIEHSLLLQLRGNRRLSFGDFPDRTSFHHEVSRYWNGSFGKLTTMPTPLFDVEIGPGDGVYIPPYRPHWLRNGDETSLSITITFFNRDNETESVVQAFNERIRKVGINPRPAGESAFRDAAKVGLMRGYSSARRRLRGVKATPR